MFIWKEKYNQIQEVIEGLRREVRTLEYKLAAAKNPLSYPPIRKLKVTMPDGSTHTFQANYVYTQYTESGFTVCVKGPEGTKELAWFKEIPTQYLWAE